ncbi:hypothetical protein [Streptomyces sp. NPDC057939]|uniref:hypothetical protein n=1 Tax=Streptomyces sp. NPDC057939 TaxID=3346284 RepID=UPI0036F140AF
MSETTTTKKATRKPDPMTHVFTDVRAAVKNLGEYTAKPGTDDRRRQHDGRASAWGKEYGRQGTFEALLLSYAFESLAAYEHEQRWALVQLAAIAVAQVEKLDSGA